MNLIDIAPIFTRISVRAVLTIKSREAGGQGHANATVTFALNDGGASIHTNAQIASW